MIPRLGDGNWARCVLGEFDSHSLENDSPSRGRKRAPSIEDIPVVGLENDSPSRGRKL